MQKITTIVEQYRSLMLDALDYIKQHPETGFHEWKTSAYLTEAFEKLGYELTQAGDVPGFYTVIDTGRPGPEILILAELDSLICPSHPEADPETGAAHVCGHCAQAATLLGIAATLTHEEILAPLSGRIRLCAVPAEELIELDFRKELRKNGTIRYLGGKAEFLHRGFFDGVDLAFMVHAGNAFSVNEGYTGFIVKKATYKGTSAHAGCAPWEGANALYAANLGLSGINAIRETFKEPDMVRVHPIISRGGDVVSAIPDVVTVETFIRASSFDAIEETNKKVNRALCGAALALNVQVEIEDFAGYAPLRNDRNLIALSGEALSDILPAHTLRFDTGIRSGSTDMGDLSCLMPAVHFYAPGSVGKAHGNDFFIVDPELACVAAAKWQIMLATKLLENNAEKALEIAKGYQAPFVSKEAYLAYLDSIFSEGNRIDYHADGSATIK